MFRCHRVFAENLDQRVSPGPEARTDSPALRASPDPRERLDSAATPDSPDPLDPLDLLDRTATEDNLERKVSFCSALQAAT